MQSMHVQPQQLHALAGNIRTGANGVKSELDQLDGEVSKLRSSWSGAAQQAYDEAQRKWTQSLTAMNDLLGQIATKTEEIGSHYSTSDSKSAGRFQG